MKNKTDSMNMGLSAEDAARGFSDPGTPEPVDASHKRRMKQGGLSGNEALSYFENPEGGAGITQPGGFLKRNNYGDRR